MQGYCKIEFGNRFTATKGTTFELPTAPQPSFHKNFELLANALDENNAASITNVIVAESPKQIDRLHSIFEEIDPSAEFRGMNVSLRGGFIDQNLKNRLLYRPPNF